MNKENVIQEYFPLVKSIANKYKHYGVPLEDLIQEGMIGLLEAEKNFDQNRNTKFSTYATYWIKKKIIKAIEQEKKCSPNSIELNENLTSEKTTYEQSRNEIGLPENMPEQEKIVLKLLFNEENTLKEIADIMKISRERVRQLKEKGLRRLRVTQPARL